MKWMPTVPIVSAIHRNRISVHDYGADVALSETGDIEIENGDLKIVAGIENFGQQVRNRFFSLTNNLFAESSQTEFDKEADTFARKLIAETVNDPILHKTYGLGHTIEEVHSIERNDEHRELIVELTCTGLDNRYRVHVPFR